jgi:hypothetical protein
MNAQRRERIIKRYDLEEQPRGTEPQERIQGLQVDSTLLPEWRLEHVDPVTRPEQPPGTRSLWTRGERGSEQILSVEIWECDSPAAAREFLLEALDQFESPEVERATDARAVGDIAFAYRDHALLYARANLVVLIRNAGRELVPVAGPAREIDERLTRGERTPG